MKQIQHIDNNIIAGSTSSRPSVIFLFIIIELYYYLNKFLFVFLNLKVK